MARWAGGAVGRSARRGGRVGAGVRHAALATSLHGRQAPARRAAGVAGGCGLHGWCGERPSWRARLVGGAATWVMKSIFSFF